MIFDRNHVGLLWRILISGDRNNESARSTQGEAKQNDRDLRHQVHGLVPSLSLSFSPKRLLNAAGK